MKTHKLTKEDVNLIEVAKKVIKNNRIENDLLSCDVGSALITDKGRIYRGINIESKTSASTSICGETSAIAQMVSDGGRKIKTIAAVCFDGKKHVVLQPCGACRHIISQFGNPWVIITKNKKVKLLDLYPLPFI
ncbi:MAG: cytidine deaminase [Candidatus Aenigmarchaeota archaeon]|nr:cytidine deaminase [Candidatus Aenigmarchaeota archaeon]